MTLLPVHPVQRLYENHTLEVIEDLIGGGPFDQASDPIASQRLDPETWRSMHKGSLSMTATIEAEKCWAFARAIAYDRYLPTVVLPRAQNMLQSGQLHGPIEALSGCLALGAAIRQHGFQVARSAA